jgi:hypothetical protein
MITKQIRFICAQPATIYFAWQVEVMINNFMTMGINPNNIDIVCWKDNDDVPEIWIKLANHYPARFFFYKDTRKTRHYISSIRPNILKQHWETYSELKDETIFYHDCDIIFTKPISQWITSEMINDTNWYGSDTRWYIGHDYILSKGEDVLNKMCEIVDIDKELIKKNELDSIGAQYLMKGINSEYWARVEKDCENLFKEITELNNEKIQIDRHTMSEGEARQPYHPLQIWCADMWAVLWGAWKLGYKTVCHPNFDFSWGTSSEEEYHKLNIMHNAGVVNSTSGLFHKAEYMNTLPYGVEIDIKENTASKKYWEWIQKTEKKSVLL